MPAILHLPHNLPCHVLQPCSSGSRILLHHPLFRSSLNSYSWISLLNIDGGEQYKAYGKVERCYGRPHTNSPGARNRVFLHASFEDYSKYRSLPQQNDIMLLCLIQETRKRRLSSKSSGSSATPCWWWRSTLSSTSSWVGSSPTLRPSTTSSTSTRSTWSSTTLPSMSSLELSFWPEIFQPASTFCTSKTGITC